MKKQSGVTAEKDKSQLQSQGSVSHNKFVPVLKLAELES